VFGRSAFCLLQQELMNDSSDRRRPRRLGDSLLAPAVEALEDSTGALQLPKLRCSDHHACRLGCEGIEAARLALCLRPLTALDQEQEPGSARSKARGRRGLEKVASEWSRKRSTKFLLARLTKTCATSVPRQQSLVTVPFPTHATSSAYYRGGPAAARFPKARAAGQAEAERTVTPGRSLP
jgi:hypothetical protein